MTERYDVSPADTDESRYANSKRNWEINPILSSPNTDFGGDDPAAIGNDHDDPTAVKPASEVATMPDPSEVEG